MHLQEGGGEEKKKGGGRRGIFVSACVFDEISSTTTAQYIYNNTQ
jgi:hypothetical protein